MDPLSDVLSLLKPLSYTCAGFDLGGDLCISVPAQEGIFCYAVVSGEIWVSVDSGPEEFLLKPNDCIVLPTGRPFNLATDLNVPPIDPETMLRDKPVESITSYHGGGKCFFIGCYFGIDSNHAEVLLNLLPTVVHIRNDEARAALCWALERMRLELHHPQPGGSLAVEHLAHLMLLQVFRLHLGEGGVGWLFALGDKEISGAIGAMHEDPSHRWTLDSLAERAGMSRTSFAVKFKESVGTSPLDYLRRWRMLLAGKRLTTASEPISAIALSLGYESESAFSTAFKKVMGLSPRQYGRRDLAGADGASQH